MKPTDTFNAEYFEHVYKRYVKKLCAICFNVVGDQDVAHEIVHNVFLSIIERRDVLKLQGEVERYLVRAVKLASMEHVRTELIHNKHLSRISSWQPETTRVTEEHIAYQDLYSRILMLKSSLSPQCREVFTLSRERGLSNKGVATSLNISEKTVEAHLSKALKYLREHLKDYSA